jgi:hypothetical protein
MKNVSNAVNAVVSMHFPTASNTNEQYVVVQTARQLSCKMIIFVSWRPDSSSELLFENSVRKFITTAIEHAVKNKCQTLAFPALGK